MARSGGTIRTYTDGTLNNSSSTSNTFNDAGSTMKLGGQGSAGNYFIGDLSNVRLVKGTVLYHGNFTSPRAELTYVTNTKLL